MSAQPDLEFERLTKLEGIGCARKRREDPRFIQGKGNYVDDVKMPGMTFGAMVRSPYAHARIKRIDTSRAVALPGVVAVITAEELKPFKLHWMPTLAGDVQAVLADGKVSFQNQEVAFVIAEDRYIAADAAELVEVEYEELPAVVDPFKALEPGAPVIREDLAGKGTGAHGARRHHNHIFNWQIGDKDKTARAFESADVTVKQDMLYPRVHPCPLETCGCVASFDKVKGDLTVYITSQAPHVVRTVVGLLSSIPESKIRIISPDIGGGFGNKVGVYPGYVCAIAASIVLGRPVKWIESRAENLTTTAFARDYWMTGELAATKDGVIKALRVNVTADHGAFDSCADPTKWPAGMFHVCTGSYAIPNAFVSVDGVYTNKFPGGVSYRCSFRVTEAVYLIERMVDVLAQKLGLDKAEIRLRNFVRKEQFPYHTPLGLEYDSGDYEPALRKAMAAMDYRGLRAEQAARRKDPGAEWLMGIGIVTFTEIVGAGPSKMCDILGVGMFDSCEIRVHPDGSAIARMGTITQGQGHQTTYAQIIASEAGIPASVIEVEEGDTSTAPYGLGTYGSRSTPVAGAAIARASRKIREKARRIAAHLLEVSPDDLEFDLDRFVVKGSPQQVKTMKEIAWAAYNNVPQGMEMGLETVDYYDPPNFTFPFGAYMCVLDINRFTGETKVRRFYALDDCGTRINPMIIEGQIHGGLTEGLAVAMGQELPYDEQGNVLGGTLMDYFVPTAVETPVWDTDFTVTPSPHHPIGAKGVAESPHVGSIPCFTSAVVDAFSHLGITHMNMPHNAYRIWQQSHELGLDKHS
jgi:aerobic carbon-monoxide dehydrogenase large subunit